MNLEVHRCTMADGGLSARSFETIDAFLVARYRSLSAMQSQVMSIRLPCKRDLCDELHVLLLRSRSRTRPPATRIRAVRVRLGLCERNERVLLIFYRLPIYKRWKTMEGLTPGNLTETQRDQLMQNLKQQIAVVNAQELLTVRATSLPDIIPAFSRDHPLPD